MSKQAGKEPAQKAHRALKKRTVPWLMEFPQARGRTVETVRLSADSDFHCISIRFQDNTDLTVVIDPWLTFRADYSRWKDGNQKVLKRWPVLRSDGM
jgi:hypothetical protein